MADPVLLGDSDMVRALSLAGLRCVLVAPPGDVARDSRSVRATLEASDAGLVDALEAHARAQDEPPVLFVQSDEGLLLVSRHRDRLLGPLRATMPDAELAEDLADEARFQRAAERAGLDIPPAAPLGEHAGLRPPCVIKPCVRDERWRALCGDAKALVAADAVALARAEAELDEAGIAAGAPGAIDGPQAPEGPHPPPPPAGGATPRRVPPGQGPPPPP